ncbi:MBL fold metallo-hydrolase [Bacteroidota bacterium]
MKAKFYGTRGSTPISDPNSTEFGGNTTCIFITSEVLGSALILDAGTGIRNLGKDIIKQNLHLKDRINLGFTHFHWDHIQGFPFFDPAYIPDSNILIAVMGNKEVKNLKDIFKVQLQSIYFPVQLENMGAKMEFVKYEVNELIGEKGLLVKVTEVQHPGGCVGIRVDDGEKSVVFCTDTEHGDGIDEKVVKLSENADVLIHDAQYTDEELKTHKGWGHSSYSQVIEVAEKANVRYLIMTHHHPDHDDEFLRRMEKQCRERFKDSVFARDNFELKF